MGGMREDVIARKKLYRVGKARGCQDVSYGEVRKLDDWRIIDIDDDDQTGTSRQHSLLWEASRCDILNLLRRQDERQVHWRALQREADEWRLRGTEGGRHILVSPSRCLARCESMLRLTFRQFLESMPN